MDQSIVGVERLWHQRTAHQDRCKRSHVKIGWQGCLCLEECGVTLQQRQEERPDNNAGSAARPKADEGLSDDPRGARVRTTPASTLR